MNGIRMGLVAVACVWFLGCTSGGTTGQPASNQATGTASNVSVTTATSTIITWNTNMPTTSQVEYGTTTAYSSVSPRDASLTTNHSVTLTGLARNTLYHYRIMSSDASGNQSLSGDLTFQTQ